MSPGAVQHRSDVYYTGHILQSLEVTGEGWQEPAVCFENFLLASHLWTSSGSCSLACKACIALVAKYFAEYQALKAAHVKIWPLTMRLNMDLRPTFGDLFVFFFTFFYIGLNICHLDISVLREYFIAFFLPKFNSTTSNINFYEALQTQYWRLSSYMKLNPSIQWTITGKDYSTY